MYRIKFGLKNRKIFLHFWILCRYHNTCKTCCQKNINFFHKIIVKKVQNELVYKKFYLEEGFMSSNPRGNSKNTSRIEICFQNELLCNKSLSLNAQHYPKKYQKIFKNCLKVYFRCFLTLYTYFKTLKSSGFLHGIQLWGFRAL